MSMYHPHQIPSVADTILHNRRNNRRTNVVFINGGDPSIEDTIQLIKECDNADVDIIELGVPFLNSFTDGATIMESHQRAIDNGVTFEDIINLVKQLRLSCSIPIVLLIDFSFSVKPRSLDTVLKMCSRCDIQASIIHGLPPLYREQYIKFSEHYGIETVFSLYPNSSKETISKVVSGSQGFIYLVSKFGRTGERIDFNSRDFKRFYHDIRTITDRPLLAGFGINSIDDIQAIYSHSDIDGVIVGSAISKLISNRNNMNSMHQSIQDYLATISASKFTSYINNSLGTDNS